MSWLRVPFTVDFMVETQYIVQCLTLSCTHSWEFLTLFPSFHAGMDLLIGNQSWQFIFVAVT